VQESDDQADCQHNQQQGRVEQWAAPTEVGASGKRR
jgi:hypothetical protein